MLKFIYKLLEIPFFYRMTGYILGPGGPYLRNKINKEVFCTPVRKALDVGCGPVSTTPEPSELMVGLDVNKSYISKFTGGYIDDDPNLVINPPPLRHRLGYVASGDRMPFINGCFDEVRSLALFHHLNNSETENTLKEMFRCIHSGGRLIMFDMIKPVRSWTRPVAWFVTRFDRGKYVRTEQELVAIFQKACPGDWQWKRHTYTFTGLELLCLQFTKK